MSEDFLAMLLGMDDTAANREGQIKRAPLAYPGCKEASADTILDVLPYRNGYCEPFGGSGIILLKRRESPLDVYNDVNGGITAFYKCLQHPQKHVELMHRLQFTVHSREMFEWARDTWNTQDVWDDVDRAVRWWFMHQISFGKKDRHYGRSTSGKNTLGHALRSNLKWFEPCHTRLANVQIENQDWRQIFKDYDREDMVWYLDPPYLCSGTTYIHEMGKTAHKEMLDRIFKLKGFVALSGFLNDQTKEMYNAYEWSNFKSWQVSTTMNGFAFTDTNGHEGKEATHKRETMEECLWIKE